MTVEILLVKLFWGGRWWWVIDPSCPYADATCKHSNVILYVGSEFSLTNTVLETPEIAPSVNSH